MSTSAKTSRMSIPEFTKDDQWQLVADMKSALDTIDANAATTSDIANLQATKANNSHTHAISDVNGLQSALDGKANTAHTHAIADVNGLQAALDSKASGSDVQAAKDAASNAQTAANNAQTAANNATVAAGNAGAWTEIKSGDDLNNFKTQGRFYQKFGTPAPANSPAPTVNIALEVLGPNDGTYIWQRAITRDGPSGTQITYVRTYASNQWTPWTPNNVPRTSTPAFSTVSGWTLSSVTHTQSGGVHSLNVRVAASSAFSAASGSSTQVGQVTAAADHWTSVVPGMWNSETDPAMGVCSMSADGRIWLGAPYALSIPSGHVVSLLFQWIT